MPAAPTAFTLNEQAILHMFNGAVSNKSAASVTWTVNEAGANHRIQRQNAAGDWLNGTVTGPTVAAAIVGKLPNNTTANLRIRSEDNSGHSAWVTLSFATGDFATVGAPPSAPTGLAAGTITSIGATLTWEDTSINEAYFVVEVRRGAEIREILVPGLTESYLLNLTTLFDAVSVPNSIYTVRVKATGGSANAQNVPPFSSAWSSEVTFKTLTLAVLITSPLLITAEKGSAFSYTITTNIPCTTWTADSDPGTGGEQLPATLTRTNAVISGTITAAVGSYSIAMTASDGTTTDAKTLVLIVVEGKFTILPPLAATAKLGVLFTHTLKARRVYGSGAAPTWSMVNAPPWLSLVAATGVISGTPDVAGVSPIQVVATSGAVGGSATFTLTVPALSITSAAAVTGFLAEPFTHQLTATSPTPPVTWEIVNAPAWMTLAPTTGKITGTPTALGVVEVDVIATFDDYEDSQTMVVTIKSLISLGNGTAVIEAWEGQPMLEELRYNGTCEVEQWYISGGPPGVQIGSLLCADTPYGDVTKNISALTGTPTASGFFDATITAQICCNLVPTLRRFAVRFSINGSLFLAWLHEDRSLYDLQFQVRGDIVHRGVRSWYARDAKAGAQISETVTDETVPLKKEVTTTTSTQEAVTANLLRAKRGDKLRLAILIRDGRTVLTAALGIAAVRLIVRLPDAVDEDYLFNLAGVATTVGANSYYLVEWTITQQVLDELMDAESVQGEPPTSGTLDVLGEIHCTLAGVELSSRTFTIRFVEDVER